MKTLFARHHDLSDTARQVQLLDDVVNGASIPLFHEKLRDLGLYPLRPSGVEIFQVNVGKMCNQTCKHCHVDAGPDRKEIMTRQTMEQCLEALQRSGIRVVDITGGAPELNPEFRWFVEQCRALGCQVIDRCNLTIILANKKFHDLPEFFARHEVNLVSSLPFYNADRTDRQRGTGVFDHSIKALRMLNKVGYGMPDTELKLNLVYNPAGAFLSSGQQVLEDQFKKVLLDEFGIRFNSLYAITNMPISRFLDFLLRSSQYEDYMEKLVTAFNPSAVAGVMCRNTISIGWDGYLYDCDFNQMLDLKIQVPGLQKGPLHVRDFDTAILNSREILLSQHCFGCTAGSGSSCGGEVVK